MNPPLDLKYPITIGMLLLGIVLAFSQPSTLWTQGLPPALQNVAPVITATGEQLYCPQTTLNIVTDVQIVDPDDTAVEAIFIQISTGYVLGQDVLALTGTHPNIAALWSPNEGRLKLYNPSGADVLYTELEAAIKDVTFYNSSPTPSGIRTFSISIGQANYLPSNGHYYYYVASPRITWAAAKAAAEASTYNGMQGYLATLTSLEESQLAGAQASGNGWIGGSDAGIEGQWKWVTGPEAGTVFWNGNALGSTPNFAFWNNGEPNNQGDEDYAHITAPGVGIPGSWNDLPLVGNTSGNYQSMGYVVEYGGMPGDPVTQTATSTKLTVLEITSTTPASTCDPGSVLLQATASAGDVHWFDVPTGGTALATGSSFTTPILYNTTTFYAATDCSIVRTPVVASIFPIPAIISTNSPIARCGPGSISLQAQSTGGLIHWFTAPTGGTAIGTGTNLTLTNITQDTQYFAEAINNGCSNGIRTPVQIFVYPFPTVQDEAYNMCEAEILTLDAGLTGMTYLWSTNETTQTINVTQSGVYTVRVTNPAGCSALKTIGVTQYLFPRIDRVDVQGTTATVYLLNNQPYYEYSIDGVNFQASNVFMDVPRGLQTMYVRDTNLCGVVSQVFFVLIVPNFFTPNADSYNDVWEVTDVMQVYPQTVIHIFDRYGKLIEVLHQAHTSWDGTYNNQELPTTDYWYVLRLDATLPEMKGHFSLIR